MAQRNLSALTFCDHAWTYREVDGRTWNVCYRCGFGERWEGGMLCESTDDVESARLDEFEAIRHV
jgi:hypothetical protein